MTVHKKEYYGENVAEVAITIRNKSGVVGKVAANLVGIANRFNSQIQIKAKGKTIDAKSLIMLMAINLHCGDDITIVAVGSDAGRAVKALVEHYDTVPDEY